MLVLGCLRLGSPLAASGERELLEEFRQLQAQCEQLVQDAKYQEAEAIAQKLLELAKGPLRSIPLSRGAACHLLGKIYYYQARYKEAEHFLQEAVHIYRDKLGEDHPQTATPINDLAVLLHAQGQYAQAEPLYREVLTFRRRNLQPGDPAIAASLNNLALFYWHQGRYAEAEPLYLESLAIHRNAANQSQTAVLLNNLGELYRHWGRYPEAESYHRQALHVRSDFRGRNHPDVAESLGNIAQLYLAQGRYADAENYLRSALNIRQQWFGQEHASVGATLANLAALYVLQTRPREAELLYHQAKEILQKAFGPEHPSVAMVEMGLGNVYLTEGRYEQAEARYQQAWRIRQRAFAPDHPLAGDSLAALGMVASKLSRFPEAEARLSQALSCHQKTYGDRHPVVARDLYWLGLVAFAQEDFARAESLFNQAEQILQRTFCEGQQLARIYGYRAQIFWKTRRPEQALTEMEKAFRALDQQRAHISGAEWERSEFFRQWAGMFELAIGWRYALGQLPELFAVMERSRARSLLEQMDHAGVDLLAGVPESEAQALRQREIRAAGRAASLQRQWEILQARRDLSASQRAAQESELLQALRLAQAEYAHAYAALRNASPTYRLLLEGGVQPVDWEHLKTWINNHQMLLLEYFLGKEASYVLSVAPGGQAEVVRLQLSTEQAQRLGVKPGPLTASQFQQIMIRPDRTGVLDLLETSVNDAQEARVAKTLAVLWEVLIPPKHREGLLNGSYRLMGVIPDGMLVWLPMETLVVQAGQPPQYLLDVGPPILYAPSATLLVRLAQRSAPGVPAAAEPVLAVGDCIYPVLSELSSEASPPAAMQLTGSKGPSLPPPKESVLPKSYASLKYTAEEIRFVAEVFGNRGIQVATLRREQATEQNFRQQAPGRRIIDLACHGRVDPTLGHFFGAFLVLSPGPKPQDPADDGLLTLQETYTLNLAGCELAILAACQTNVGPQQPGEGVWSLARGFLVAGARRVVAGNWLLDDMAAASTVSYFCAILAQQEAALAQPAGDQTAPATPPFSPSKPAHYARALQEAKRWVRSQSQWRTPYYWAPLILIGPP